MDCRVGRLGRLLLAKPSDIYLSHCTLLLNALSCLSCARKSRVGHGMRNGNGKGIGNGITLNHCARYFLAESESHVHYFRPHVCKIILIMHLHFRQTVAGIGQLLALTSLEAYVTNRHNHGQTRPTRQLACSLGSDAIHEF